MCMCVRPVVRRNAWLALRLSRPQVIQLNAFSVVIAACVLHTTMLQQEGVSRLLDQWKTKENCKGHFVFSGAFEMNNKQK